MKLLSEYRKGFKHDKFSTVHHQEKKKKEKKCIIIFLFDGAALCCLIRSMVKSWWSFVNFVVWLLDLHYVEKSAISILCKGNIIRKLRTGRKFPSEMLEKNWICPSQMWNLFPITLIVWSGVILCGWCNFPSILVTVYTDSESRNRRR